MSTMDYTFFVGLTYSLVTQKHKYYISDCLKEDFYMLHLVLFLVIL